MKRIFCFLFGHKITSGLFETDEVISGKGCKRCGAPLFGTGFHWKGVRSVPPPFSTKSEWEDYCDINEAKLRKEFAK